MLLPRETILSLSCLFSLSLLFFKPSLIISRSIRCAIFVCWCSALKWRAGLVPAKDVSHRRPCWNSDRRPHIGCTCTQVRHILFLSFMNFGWRLIDPFLYVSIHTCSNFMRQQAMASKMVFNRPVPVNRLVSTIADSASFPSLSLSTCFFQGGAKGVYLPYG